MRQNNQPEPNAIFREVTVRVCGDLDIDRALSSAREYLSAFLPVEDLGLFVFEKNLGAIRLVASSSPTGHATFELSPSAVMAMSKRARAELSGTALPDVRIVNRPSADLVTREITAEIGDRRESSLLLMRLVIRGERLGSIMLRADGPDRFTPQHAELMRQLNEPFAIALSNALRFQELQRLRDMLAEDNRELRTQLSSAHAIEVVGADFGLRDVMQMVRQVAPSTSPVLLLGETGTGKEVIASAIHQLSTRRDGPFVRVNCGAMAESLVDSELFGHEKGAFTGAVAQARGRFERADKGTILLDEIGDLPLAAQVKLLRVLQTGEFERVGGHETLSTDTRIIAATHRDLDAMTRDGSFRQDLWFRLSVFPLRIPPLRERRTDIPALAQNLIDRKSREMNLAERPGLAAGAIDQLLAYDWPGNVRELQNVIERALILSRGQPLTFAGLGSTPPKALPVRHFASFSSSDALDDVTADHLRRTLEASGGKIEGPGGAAELLRLNPSTLRNKLRKFGIPFGRRP